MEIYDINLLSVFVVTLIIFFIRLIWYSKVLFGNTYKKMVSIKIEENKKTIFLIKNFFLTILQCFVLSLFVSFFVSFLYIEKFWEGLQLGLFLWLGFITTTLFDITIWEAKPFKLYLINIFYYLISLMIAGSILTVWQ